MVFLLKSTFYRAFWHYDLDFLSQNNYKKTGMNHKIWLFIGYQLVFIRIYYILSIVRYVLDNDHAMILRLILSFIMRNLG